MMADVIRSRDPKKRFAVVIIAPQGYAHWQAFKEIGDCLHFGLVELGYDSIQCIDSCDPERVNIVLGGNLLAAGRHLPAESIIFNLEQIYVGSPWLSDTYIGFLRQYRVWDYSRKNILVLKQMGIDDVALVPVGYVSQLSRVTPRPKDIDILFYGSPGERRERVLRRLKLMGANVCAVFGTYGEQRDLLIARSKIVLNVHFHESRLFEIVRIGYLLANGAFIVSEDSDDHESEKELQDGLVVVPYRHLVKTCLKYLEDEAARTAIAKRGFELFRGREQSRFLAQALGQG